MSLGGGVMPWGDGAEHSALALVPGLWRAWQALPADRRMRVALAAQVECLAGGLFVARGPWCESRLRLFLYLVASAAGDPDAAQVLRRTPRKATPS